MRCPYLGRASIFWCDRCHVPVLGEECACGAATRPVPLTPPGDARPAFGFDIGLINTLYHDHFGVRLVPEGHLVLMNKVPERDRMEEIVIGGAVVAAIRYLPDVRRWEVLPRAEAAALARPGKRVIVVDDRAAESIRQGASLLAPGLVEIPDEVRTGDEVFMFDTRGRIAGVGRAKMDAGEARRMQRGAIVRTRKNPPGNLVTGTSGWEDAVRANEMHLRRSEEEAIDFVRRISKRNPQKPTVSYSGGKDSLATLLVVMKALGKVPLIFADSGLEFRETCRNVEEVSARYGLEVARATADGDFWNEFERQGPPAVNHRWCCRCCKLAPVERLIRTRWGECLSFVGQRRFESLKRMRQARVWRGREIPGQLAAAPLKEWSSLQVWLYLFRERAPYNELYERGFDRVGCYICPSSDLAVMERIRKSHPDLWGAWISRLESWRERQGLPDGWVQDGLWRVRR